MAIDVVAGAGARVNDDTVLSIIPSAGGAELCIGRLGNLAEFQVSTSQGTWLVHASDPDRFARRHCARVVHGSARSLFFVTQTSAGELGVKCLTQTLPTNRLYHLLHCNRFDDAIRFAQQFQLDMDIVYRVQATALLDRSLSSPSAALQPQLSDCLAKIEDLDFVVDTTMQACFPDVQTHSAVLLDLLKRLGVAKSRDKDSLLGLAARVQNTLKRLGTFQLGMTGEFDAQQWQTFRTSDLTREVISALSKGRVASALIIWTRHAIEYDMASQLVSILSAVPDSIPLAQISAWLANDVMPSVEPQHHLFLLSWVERRCHAMERLEPAHWPASALQLIDLVAPTLFLYSQRLAIPATAVAPLHVQQMANRLCGRVSDGEAQQPLPSHSELASLAAELEMLQENLRDMQYLKEHLNYKCSYAHYTATTPQRIAFHLLQQTHAVELFAGTVDSVAQYMARHKLQPDELLTAYMREVLVNLDPSAHGSAWEAKAVAVVKCIQSPTAKTISLISLLSHAPVPLSAALQSLLESALTWNTEHSDELREHARLARLKVLLLPYHMKHFNLSDASQAATAVRRILSRADVPTSLDDALELTRAYDHLHELDTYVFWAQHRALASDFDPIPTFTHLSRSLASGVCHELLLWVSGALNEPLLIDADAPDHALLAAFATSIAQLALDLAAADPSMHDRISPLKLLLLQLQSIGRLHRAFGICPPLRQLGTLSGKLELLHALVPRLSRPAHDHPHAFAPHAVPQLTQLTGLLDISAAELLLHLSDRCWSGTASDLEVHLAFQQCFEHMEHPPSAALSRAITVATQALLKLAEMHPATHLLQAYPRWPRALSIFADFALQHSAPEHACDALEVSKACKLLVAAVRLSKGASHVDEADAHVEPPTHPLLAPPKPPAVDHFVEDGLVMETEPLLVHQTAYLSSFLTGALAAKAALYAQRRVVGSHSGKVALAKGDGDHVANVSLRLRPAIQQLRDSQHCQLALRLAVDAFAVCAQHYSVNQGVFPEVEKSFKTVAPRAAAVIVDIGSALLTKVLSGRHLDRELAVAYLSLLPMQVGFQKFRDSIALTKKEFAKLSHLALVGVGFATMWQEAAFLAECRQLSLNSTWWGRLQQHGVAFDRKAFEANQKEYVVDLVPRLFQQSNYEPSITLEFVADFKLDREQCIRAIVKAAFLENAALSGEEGRVHAMVAKMVRASAHKPQLGRLLIEDIFPLISPYDYARCAFLFRVAKLDDELLAQHDQLAQIIDRGALLVRLLHSYARVASPGPYENDAASSSKSVSPADVSTWAMRLPLHHLLLGETWKIIEPEATMANISKVVAVARVLGIKPENMYAASLDSAFRACQSECGPDLAPLKEVIEKITEPSAAVAAAKLVADKYPLSDRKVAALQLGVDLAALWMSRFSDAPRKDKTLMLALDEVTSSHEYYRSHHTQATKVHERLASLHRSTSIELLLRDGNMLLPNLATLLHKPQELVRELYERFAPQCLAALHEAADSIGRLCSVDVEAVRQHLVSKWLLSEQAEQPVVPPAAALSLTSALDDSMEGEHRHARAGDLLHDDAVRKTVFLLRRGERSSATTFLLKVVFADASQKIKSVARFRAFQALFALASTDEVLRLSGRTAAELRVHVLAVTYV